MAEYLSIREWKRFQHYKDRDPPWIKLHRELLTSRTWVSLDDASRVLAIACMLLAAGTDNKIPADKAYLRRVAYLNADPDWSPLLRTQFLDLIDENGKSLAPASTPLANGTECSSEERRGEQRRDRAEKISVAQKRDDGPAERIFEHWRQEFRHPRAVLDAKRRKVITAALSSFDEASVCAAISGYKLSPHHMGENDQRTVYDDIELFLRDVSHIERGLNFARAPPKPQMSAVERAREKLRNGNGNGRVVSEQFGGTNEPGLGTALGVLRRLPDS